MHLHFTGIRPLVKVNLPYHMLIKAGKGRAAGVSETFWNSPPEHTRDQKLKLSIEKMLPGMRGLVVK
jgi:hypothetical protein